MYWYPQEAGHQTFDSTSMGLKTMAICCGRSQGYKFVVPKKKTARLEVRNYMCYVQIFFYMNIKLGSKI